jgi:hypothetical protein
MSNRTPAAGGFFLVIAILAGFVIGMTRGDPVGGSLIGTIVGAVAATVLWIVDRRRAGR